MAATGTSANGGDGAKEDRQAEYDKLIELVAAADAPKPKPGAVAELRRFLDARPHIPERLAFLASSVEEKAFKKVAGEKAGMGEVIRGELKGIRDRLDYENAPELERLIIAEITISWLWLEWHHYQLAAAETFKAGEQWEKRLASAQRRFLRACTSLARVHKLTERRMSPAAAAYLKSAIG